MSGFIRFYAVLLFFRNCLCDMWDCFVLFHCLAEFALATASSSDAMLRGLQGILLDSAYSDGELYSQTLWYD